MNEEEKPLNLSNRRPTFNYERDIAVREFGNWQAGCVGHRCFDAAEGDVAFALSWGTVSAGDAEHTAAAVVTLPAAVIDALDPGTQSVVWMNDDSELYSLFLSGLGGEGRFRTAVLLPFFGGNGFSAFILFLDEERRRPRPVLVETLRYAMEKCTQVIRQKRGRIELQHAKEAADAASYA